MLSIDEAIAHAREVAKRNREQWKNCPADRRDIEHQTCEQCAEEHEQLAEWLEELKVYHQHEVICNKGYNAGYNKAIDDFAILMKETLNHDWATTKISEQIIYNRLFDKCNEIAEQLKAGGEND